MKSDGYPFLDREMVVLIDPNDREIGQMGKLEAHRTGRLHRAFSVFIFNAQGELLLQQRAANKYHSASLWTNTCCGHPRPGEALVAAGERRLEEEMGLHVPLRPAFHFTYAAKLEDGLTEHELDHVLIGRSDRDPRPGLQLLAADRPRGHRLRPVAGHRQAVARAGRRRARDRLGVMRAAGRTVVLYKVK